MTEEKNTTVPESEEVKEAPAEEATESPAPEAENKKEKNTVQMFSYL